MGIQYSLSFVRRSVHRMRRAVSHPYRTLACCPTNASFEDRRILIQTVGEAICSDVVLVSGPLAAAVGAGLDVASKYAQMVIDIGEGTTKAAIIRAGRIVVERTSPVACGQLHSRLRISAREHLGIVLDRLDAERLTRELGSAPEWAGNRVLREPAVHVTKADPETRITSVDVNRAIHPTLRELSGFVNRFLRDLRDDVACEVIENGICLTGGGACIPGMAGFLGDATGIETRIAIDPVHAAINGAARMIEDGRI
jgi:rod shape-determining protein MreB and related proteins